MNVYFKIFHFLMKKMSHSGKQHRYAVFVGGIDGFLISHTSTRLNNGFDAFFSTEINHIAERKKRIRCQYQIAIEFFFGSFYCLLCRPDSVDLSASNTQSLISVGNDNGIGFYIFYNTLCK